MDENDVGAAITFRYHMRDSADGVTHDTVRWLAEQLGVDEEQAIHRALRQLVNSLAPQSALLPQYPPDDGRLTDAQIASIRKLAPVRHGPRSVRSSLIDIDLLYRR